MRKASLAALASAGLLGGCAYYQVAPDPIRIGDSQVEMAGCRSLGRVGGPIRTDGRGPYLYGSLTYLVPPDVPEAVPFGGFGTQPESNNLAVALEPLRNEALRRGATDLLLVRRMKRDWSYVEGVAYRCRH